MNWPTVLAHRIQSRAHLSDARLIDRSQTAAEAHRIDHRFDQANARRQAPSSIQSMSPHSTHICEPTRVAIDNVTHGVASLIDR